MYKRQAQGAMAALLKDALKPNLVQTLEHTPAFVHGGPLELRRVLREEIEARRQRLDGVRAGLLAQLCLLYTSMVTIAKCIRPSPPL